MPKALERHIEGVKAEKKRIVEGLQVVDQAIAEKMAVLPVLADGLETITKNRGAEGLAVPEAWVKTVQAAREATKSSTV